MTDGPGLAEGHVYLTRQLTPVAMHDLDRLAQPVRVNPDPDWPPARSQLLAEVAGACGLISLLTEQVDAELLEAAGPNLRIVANVAVGTDNVDLAAATRRGVVVTNTPGVLDAATADLTLALLLALSRRVVEADQFLRSGHPWVWGPNLFTGLDVSAGATVGIIGLGRIGTAVAERCRAFGMRILATGKRAEGAAAQRLGVQAASVEELLSESDVVTLHCPLTPETHHLIGSRELQRMKPSAVLINTSRGPVVDEAALVEALQTGTIAGAGLDVFENEPEIHPELLGLPNVVLLPHLGSAGQSTRDRMGQLAIANVDAVLSGRAPLTRVN